MDGVSKSLVVSSSNTPIRLLWLAVEPSSCFHFSNTALLRGCKIITTIVFLRLQKSGGEIKLTLQMWEKIEEELHNHLKIIKLFDKVE